MAPTVTAAPPRRRTRPPRRGPPCCARLRRRTRSAAASPPRDAGDLLQEGAGLVDETFVLTEADTGCVHRQTAGDIRVVRTDDHAAETAVPVGPSFSISWNSRRTLLLPLRGALVAEHLQREPVGVAGGDSGDLDDADAVVEAGAEAGVVVVLDSLEGSLTAACPWPITVPSGTGRSVIAVANRPPLTS